MAYSVVPRPQRPLGLRLKQWMKASDPAPYKGCMIFLLTLYQLFCSGLEHSLKKMEGGSALVWWLVRKGEGWVVEVDGRRSAVLATSSLVQLLVLLCRDVHLYPSHDGAFSNAEETSLLNFGPSVDSQFCSDAHWSMRTHFLPLPGCVVVLVPYLTCVATCLWRYVQQCSRSLANSSSHSHLRIHKTRKRYPFSLQMKLTKLFSLRCCVPLLCSCLSSTSSLALWKCVKKKVSEAMMWAQDRLSSFRGRTALRLGVMMIFVNQMLLMIAGDVETNPGPGNLGPDNLCDVLEAIIAVKHKWHDIGLNLKIQPHTLEGIKADKRDSADCLKEMLTRWLCCVSPPPTWSGLVQALSSKLVQEEKLAENIRKRYCHQDGEQAAGPVPVSEDMDKEHMCWDKRGKGRNGERGRSNTRRRDTAEERGKRRHRCRERDREEQLCTGRAEQLLQGGGSRGVRAHISQLIHKFASLRTATQQELEKARVSVKSLLDTLYDLPNAKKPQHREFLMKYEKHFEECNNTGSVFRKLNTYWNYLNIDILAHLIRTFHLRYLNSQLNVYKEELKHFMEWTTLREYYEVEGDQELKEPPEGFAHLVSRHNWDPPIYLKKVDDFRRKLACTYDLHACVVILVSMDIGSAVITMMVPESMMAMINSTDVEFFTEHGIIHLHLKGTCVYKQTGDEVSPSAEQSPCERGSEEKAEDEFEIVRPRSLSQGSSGRKPMVLTSEPSQPSQMALIKESGETSLEHAREASQQLEEGNLLAAKTSLAKAERNAGKHMKDINYWLERCTAVQEHYQQQQRELTERINNVLANEQSVEIQKSAAVTQLGCEQNELSRHTSDLSSAEDRLSNARRKARKAKRKHKKAILGGAVLTTLSFGAAAPFTAPLAAGAGMGAVAFGEAEKKAQRDISMCHSRINDTQRKISQTQDTISSLSSRISQLSNEKSSYMAQRSHLQEEKGKMEEVITFLLDAQKYLSEFSNTTEECITLTALTGMVVVMAKTRGYNLFDSKGTKRVLTTFEEVWDAFEEMNRNGSNFEMDFKCTRCSTSYRQFPHVNGGQLICSSCHDTLVEC